MGPSRTSLRFVVGTALLTAAGTSSLAGCDKPAVNTPDPNAPSINTPPERPEDKDVNPGEGPIVNTAAPTPDPEKQPEPGPPDPSLVINTPPDPEPEPPTVNIVNQPPTKKPPPADKRPKKYVNTAPDDKPK